MSAAPHRLMQRIHYSIDRSCSAVVSLSVIGVNLLCFSWTASTVVIPVMTSCCCLTAAISKILKRVINQSRPNGAQKLSPGMPSNHATSLAFLAIAACVGLDRYSRAHDSPSGWWGGAGTMMAAQTLLISYSLYAAALRVVCGHHTVPQVIVGYAFGAVSAIGFLSANYYNYKGSRAGGRVDDLPVCIKQALLWGSVLTGCLAFCSILRGSPLLGNR